MGLSQGIRLGPYEIVALLGAGGMGEVYRARDTRLERAVAVKVLADHLSSSPEIRERFEREAHAISSLNHPRICTLHDVGRHDGTDYLVMEYLEGQTLAERLAEGPLPLKEVLRIGAEVCEGLEAAHRQGLVHRDLKPGNIMLTKSGAKLMDFGLAKPIGVRAAAGAAVGALPSFTAVATISGPSPLSPLTAAGSIVGTIQYMSPEQIEGKDANARSDIFAFGAMLYEMATGKRPFEGKSQIKVAAAILEDEPPPVSTVRNATPPALCTLISRMMAKDPEQRWQCATDVRYALTSLCAEQAKRAEPAVVPHWRAVMPWATAVILAIALVVVFFYRATAAQPQRVLSYLIPPADQFFDSTGDGGAPPAISPDGSKLIFGAGGKLWLRHLDQESARELEDTEGASFPFWSPDGRSVGMFQAGKLRTLDIQGGGPVTICDATNARGGSWSSAGFILFAPTIQSEIMKVAATGGTPVAVTKLKSGQETTHRWPQILPDQKHFLYFAANHRQIFGESTGVFVGSTDGGEPVTLLHVPTSATFANGKVIFLRGADLLAQDFDTGRLRLTGTPEVIRHGVDADQGVWRPILSVSENGMMVYRSGESGMHKLRWFSSNGQPQNSAVDGSYASTALSPSGNRVAETSDPEGILWVANLNGSTRVKLTTDRATNPVWSPDERQIVYGHVVSSGFAQLMIRAADGTGSEKALSPEPAWQVPTDWSRDGKYILYERGDPGSAHVWALPLMSGGRPFPVVQTQSWDRDGHFSPEGKWVIFTSRESGTDQIYITPFPGPGPKFQVSRSTGGSGARWSSDGKWVCYWNGAQNVLFRVSVSTSGPSPVIGDEQSFVHGAAYKNPFSDADYSLSRDGRVLVNQIGEQSSRLTLLTNWQADQHR